MILEYYYYLENFYRKFGNGKKFIPKLLSAEHKNLGLEMSQDQLEMATNNENKRKKIMNGDEWWVYECDHETKQQSSPWEQCQVSEDCFFTIMKVMCTMNKLLGSDPKNMTVKFWKDWIMQLEENEHVIGEAVTDFFTKITH